MFSLRPDDLVGGLVRSDVALSTTTLCEAISRGVFPVASSAGLGRWYNPPGRGILRFSQLRVSKSNMKVFRRLAVTHEVSISLCFHSVISGCASVPRWRINEEKKTQYVETWITPDFIQSYCALYELGLAHSLEVWSNNQLVGGLYGTCIGGVFSGESMFKLTGTKNVGTFALLSLINVLRDNKHTFIDTQQNHQFFRRLGGDTISRRTFLNLRRKMASKGLPFPGQPRFISPGNFDLHNHRLAVDDEVEPRGIK